MLSKRYESTEVDRRFWLLVPSGTDGQPALTITNMTETNKYILLLFIGFFVLYL